MTKWFNLKIIFAAILFTLLSTKIANADSACGTLGAGLRLSTGNNYSNGYSIGQTVSFLVSNESSYYYSYSIWVLDCGSGNCNSLSGNLRGNGSIGPALGDTSLSNPFDLSFSSDGLKRVYLTFNEYTDSSKTTNCGTGTLKDSNYIDIQVGGGSSGGSENNNNNTNVTPANPADPADTDGSIDLGKDASGKPNKGTLTDLPGLVNRIATIFDELLGALGFIGILVGGIMYLVSGSNPSMAEKAKKTFIYSIIGMLVGVFAYAITYIVYNLIN